MLHIFSRTHKSMLRLMVFWLTVFVLNMGPHWEDYGSLLELVATVGNVLLGQIVVASVVLLVLVPNFLDKDRLVLFILYLITLLVLMSLCQIVVRYYYIEPTYPDTYANLSYVVNDLGIGNRIANAWAFKYIVFSKMPMLFFPTAVLLALQFYKTQRDVAALKEQKNNAELTALKNQLNPHFLFNTLNNLYLLALKKSDHTPVVIEKLAHILDYLVYRCNDRFVSINNEIDLIQNYLDLECLRQTDRLEVTFVKQLTQPHSIAPLVLLTLVENACKHSMANELNKATVEIRLITDADRIVFDITNSKPSSLMKSPMQTPSIGICNMKKQLNMLYGSRFDMAVVDTDTLYQVTLTILTEKATS